MTASEGARERHIDNDQFQHIARISHGKDSLKMLDVIVTRGLPLDRITTTDVWATDTIRGEHPEMVKFKDMADEYIWRKYRIEVEHLCAMRNGEKLTYEKLFYHVPKRKNAGGGYCRRNKGVSLASRPCGARGASQTSNEPHEIRIRFPCTNRELVQETQNRLYTASRSASIEQGNGAPNSKRGF